MNLTKKIKRDKFIKYSLLAGFSAIIFKNLPFTKSNNRKLFNRIIIKSNPLSVKREKLGGKNV